MALSFLNFWALAGILALSVPILIHYLKLRRNVQSVPSLLLFMGLKRSNPHRRLEELLLLCLRCLALLLLTLLLAHPVLRWKGAPGESAPDDTVFLFFLDDSALSLHGFSSVSGLELEKDAAQREISALPENARIVLATSSGAFRSDFLTKREAGEMLERITAKNIRVSPGASLASVISSLNGKDADRRLMVFLCVVPFPETLEELRRNGMLPPDAYYVPSMKIPPTELDPYLRKVDFRGNESLQFYFGGAEHKLSNSVVEVKTWKDSKIIRVQLTASDVLNKRLILEMPDADFSSGALVTLRDRGSTGQNTPSQSEYHLSPPETVLPAKILLLYDGADSGFFPVSSLYFALDSIPSLKNRIRLVNYRKEALAKISGETYSCVIVPPVSVQTPELTAFLESVLSSGGDVMLFPPLLGDRSVMGAFQVRWLAPMDLGGAKPVLFVNTPGTPLIFLELYRRGLSLAALQKIRPPEQQPSDRVIYRLENSPLLTFRNTGNGRLILWSLIFDPPPLSLLMNPLFPDLVQNLASPVNSGAGASFESGTSFDVTGLIPERIAASTLLLQPPDASAPQKLTPPPDALLPFTPLQPGLYALSDASGAFKTLFAVNLPRPVRTPMLAPGLAASPRTISLGGNKKESLPETSAGITEKDLTPLLAILLALVLGIELLLAVYRTTGRRAVL